MKPSNIMSKWLQPKEVEKLQHDLDLVVPQWTEAGAVTPSNGPPEIQLPFQPQLAASGELNAAAIMEQATLVVRKFENEHLAAQTEIERLSAAVIQAAADQKSDRQKITFLELENLQLRNDIQTLSAANEGYRQFFSRILEKCDEFDIKRQPKPARAKRERRASTKEQEQELIPCNDMTLETTSTPPLVSSEPPPTSSS